MFPDHHISYAADRTLHPDRRPLPTTAGQIRLRVKRVRGHKEA
jgi:hypothetical protein